MKKIELNVDWLQPEPEFGIPEFDATYAALKVWIGDNCITERRNEANSISEALYLPIYPLTEWIVFNWFFLFFEYTNPVNSIQATFKTRHLLSSASSGFPLPQLLVTPSNGEISFTWRETTPVHTKFSFISNGHFKINEQEVEDELKEFIEAIILRLESSNIFDTPLQKEWEIIRRLSHEELEYCKLCASLGADPFEVPESISEHIEYLFTEYPSHFANEYLNAINGSNISSALKKVDILTEQIKTPNPETGQLSKIKKALHQSLRSYANQPWIQGYDAARALRSYFSLNGSPLTDISELSELVKMDIASLFRGVNLGADLNGINAISNQQDNLGAFYFRPIQFSKHQVFTFGRLMYEYLTSEVDELGIVTHTNNSNQKRNRAFAAELLLPASKLRNELSGRSIISRTDIDELSEKFQTTSQLIEHQVYNHRIAQIKIDEFE